jgi:hypothetical protein
MANIANVLKLFTAQATALGISEEQYYSTALLRAEACDNTMIDAILAASTDPSTTAAIQADKNSAAAICALGGPGSGVESLVGFLDASQVTLGIDDLSRTLTVTPVGASFVVYVANQRFTKIGVQSKSWPDSNGLHYFYFDEAGTLQVIQTFDPYLITKYAFVSVVYWDQANQKHIYWANERHGIYMGTSTHRYLHNTRGAQWDNGLSLTGFTVDGGGGSNTHAQFTSLGGVIWDEDIRFSLPAQSQIPVLYKTGAGLWKRKTPDAYPVIYAGSVPGYAGTRLPYNLNSGGTWSLAQVDTNKFVLVHVFATNDIEYPVVAIQGVSQYNSKADARNGAVIELQSLSDMPFAEFAPLGSVIFETRDAYANTPKARIVSTVDGANYEDKRGIYFRPNTL